MYFSGNGVSRVNFTESNPVIEDVVSGLNSTVWGIDILNDELYMALQLDGQILKYDLSNLSTSNFESNKEIIIYPNPVEDLLSIANIKDGSGYCIYDINGKLLLNGFITPNQNINLRSLESGTYFLKIQDEKKLKFLKK